MDKDAFYFPHFSNARLDRKIKRVRKELGLEGYGIYFMILETLRDQENFSFPIEDIDLLSDEFGTSEQKIRTVILNYDLFSLDDNEHFFSPKLLVFLQPYLEGKEKRRVGGIKGNLIRYKHITKEEAKDLNDAQILDIHNSISFKSAFKDLPIAKGSLTESGTDRFSSQRKGNTIQFNEIQNNTIQLNENIKEKNTKKETPYQPPTQKDQLSTMITNTISHWNDKSNLPTCRYSIINIPKIGEVRTMFDVHGIDLIHTAINNLSKAYDGLDQTYRPKNFQNFICNSLDNWFEVAEKDRTYKTDEERNYHKMLAWGDVDPEELEQRRLAMEESLIERK
jgi:hypothetical protein